MKLAEALAAQAAIAIQNALLYEQLQAGQVQMRRLTQQVVDIQEEERYRVSRELHDEAGQALTALKFSLAMILSELPTENEASKLDPHLVRQHVKSAIALCESTMDQIRKLAHDLRPSALDDLGLNPALEGFCIDFEQRTPLRIHYMGEEPPNMPDAATITFYRFLQESLTNVAKHAQATEVSVHLWFDEEFFHLSVEDDGCGFDYLGMDSENGRDQGIGLRGMQERLQLVDGSLDIKTDREQGSLLKATIPRSF
jgi:signal transduction histidine kinase